MTTKQKAPGWQPGSPQDNSAPLDNPTPESTQAEIVLHDQAETEVYFDEDGCLVIGQANQFGNPEVAIFIAPENVQTFAPRDRPPSWPDRGQDLRRAHTTLPREEEA
jgi:hypothetical protein